MKFGTGLVMVIFGGSLLLFLKHVGQEPMYREEFWLAAFLGLFMLFLGIPLMFRGGK
jgi:hypothetical protein